MHCAARGFALLLALTIAGSTHAQGAETSAADDMARRHFQSGVAYLEESDYDNALHAFEKAYELSKRPEILLNIAAVHERRGDLASAISALQGYLDRAPSGEHAESVKLRIQNLEKRRASEPARPPVTAAAAGATAAPPPPPAAQAAPAPAPAPAPAAPSSQKPNRIPVYVAFGVGAAAAGGAILTGILAKSEYDSAESSCSPSCTDDELSTGRGLALTSTILTGVAVVGAGVGVTLLLLEKPAEAASAGRSLAIGLAPAPGGGRASAVWRF